MKKIILSILICLFTQEVFAEGSCKHSAKEKGDYKAHAQMMRKKMSECKDAANSAGCMEFSKRMRNLKKKEEICRSQPDKEFCQKVRKIREVRRATRFAKGNRSGKK